MRIKLLGLSGSTNINLIAASTNKLTLEEFKAVAATTGLERAELERLLILRGLTKEEAKQTANTILATRATQEATVANNIFAATTNSVKTALGGLGAVIKAHPIMAIITAATLAITVFEQLKQKAEEAAREATQNAVENANTLKSSLEDIDGYISKIDEIKEALSKDDISQSEATEKRKELLKIQEELIKKYGQEKDAVDYITESIQGETTALNNLQIASVKDYLRNNRDKIKDAYDYFNNSESRTVAMNDYHDLASVEAGYGDFMKILTGFLSPNQYNKGNGETYFNGTKDEIIAQYDDLRDKIQKYIYEHPIAPNDNSREANWGRKIQGYLNEYLDNLSEARNQIVNDENYDSNRQIYDTAVESLIMTSNKYSEYYEKIVEKKKAYTEALASGNQDEITQAYIEMRDLFNEIFSLDFLDEDNVSGESIKAWFEGVKQQIELQSKETPIIVDIQAELKDSPDGYNNKIKEIVNKNNYTSDDINSIISKGDLNYESLSGDEKNLYDNIKGYVDLWNDIAQYTGQAEIKVEQYIGALEKLGIVKAKVAEKNDESSFALSKDQTKELKSVHSDVDKLNKAYQNLFAGKLTTNDVTELVDLFPTLGEYVDWTDEKFGNLAEGIDKVIKERPADLIKQLEEIDQSGMSEDAKKAINSMISALKQLKPELKDTKTLIEDIQKAIKGVSSSISTLIGFTKEISSDGALSLSSIDTIMTDDTYKSLRPYINDMEGMQTAITELVAKQKDAYEDLYNAEMYENDYEAYHKAVQQKEQENENLLSDSIKQIDDEIKYFNDAYGIDITNWDNLIDTKKNILQNTNAELLSKQNKLINDFANSYGVDLRNFANAADAKQAVLDNLSKSQAAQNVRDYLNEHTELGADWAAHTPSSAIPKDVQDEVSKLLSGVMSFEAWQDWQRNGTLSTMAGNEIQKSIEEIIKGFTINSTDWEKMTKNTGGSGGSSSSSSKNYIDWIERRLKKFAQNTKEVFARVADYISFNNQNSQLRKAINAIRDEIAFNERAYNYYMTAANEVGLDPYWIDAVVNGASNVMRIDNDELQDKINRYKEYYDNAMNCKNAVDELRKTEKEYANQMLSNVEKYYSNRIDYANQDAEYYNSLDTDNLFMNKNFDAIRKSYNEQISYTQKEHDDLLNTLNSLVSNGSIKYQSDEWYEWWAKIQKCNVEVRNLKKSIHDLASEELQNIQGYWDNRIGVYDNTISYINTVGGDTTRKGSKNYKGLSSAYNFQISYTNKQVSELQTRLNKAVKAGDIEKYSDKWYEWTGIIEQGKEKVVELQTSIHQLAVDEFNDIAARYDNLINKIEHKNNLLEESISQTQEKGYIVSTKYYNALITNEQNNISKLSGKRNDLYANLQQAIKSGNIQEGSEEWHKMVQEIESVDLAIEQANTSVIKFNNSIRDIQWQVFDLLQDRISQISAESNFLINLMKNDDLYVKKGQGAGQLTNQGLSTMGLHGVNYDVYMAQSNKYAQEILKIDKQLAKDPYNQTLINRRKELLKLQQDMIISANDEKQAIVSMVKDGIELELSSLKELIDKYNESLDKQKDLYDYQKKVKEQAKEIASLEKQMIAFAGDNSEETKAKVQQLKVNLETARENLQETQYDKFVSDSKKLLDDFYNDYETILNQRLDNVDSLISDMINHINGNASTIQQTIVEASNSVGYSISNSMNTILGNKSRLMLWEDVNVSNNNVILAVNNLTNSINRMVTVLDNNSTNTIGHYKKYKSGTHTVNYNQMAWTNENGNSEVIIRKSDGAILTPLAKDDMVLNGYATDNLFSIANDPSKFIRDNLFSANQYNGTSNINNVNSNYSVSVDNINLNLPNVKNYEDFFYAAQHDKRFEKMVQAMTVDKLFGGSSLKKYRV